MSVDYFKPPDEVKSLVKKIRHKYYSDLRKAKIVILMRSGAWNKYGTMGRISKKQQKMGINGDYILTLNAEEWPNFSSHQKKALVDHELYHCVKKKTKKGTQWRLRHHEVEEFIDIVKRYGDWRPSLTEMKKALKGSR